MINLIIQAAIAADIVEVRTKILRPGQWPIAESYPQDGLSSTYHFSAKLKEETIGVATFMVNPPPEKILDRALSTVEKTVSLQLRGMGVLGEFHRQGVGAKLMHFAMRFFSEGIYDPKTTLLWFNARERAIPFYQTLGFKTAGEFFQVPNIGPHKIMWCILGEAS